MKFATDCPKPVKPGFEFNATFTKLIMYRIAVAAYVNNPTKCLSRFADDVVVCLIVFPKYMSTDSAQTFFSPLSLTLGRAITWGMF